MSTKLTIPLGSQHIALLEPVRFLFTTDNEVITDVEVDAGYVHRGIEKACAEKFKFKQVGYVVARVCGLCAITHSTAYTLAIEKAMQIAITPRAAWLRILTLELDRIHSHLLCLAHTAENSGFEALFMQTMNDRELVMQAQDWLTGNRVQFDYVSIGGVNRDLTPEAAAHISTLLDQLQKRLEAIEEAFTTNPLLSLRYKGIGAITKQKALEYGVVGPMAKAAGIATDVRAETDALPYKEVGFSIITAEGGDIDARNRVRLSEVRQSLTISRHILEGLPEGEISVKVKGNPEGEAVARIEAPRGELFYYIKGNKKPILERMRIRTPTFAQIPAMVEIFKGSNYADTPAILASFDPCLSCTAR
ncbi:MAG: nickel-dependent hydrogenase large subunit [Campylobacterales bacterium]